MPDIVIAQWNGVASFVSGRDGDDSLNTDDGDAIDAMHGGAGTNTCSTVDGDRTKC